MTEGTGKTPPRALSILLAEDDEGHASLVARNLKRSGIANNLVHAKDGQEALDYVYCEGKYLGEAHEQPLLLLLDINMPRVDGVEVLRRLKEVHSTSGIPVIVLSTTDDPREVAKCYSLGCSVYIKKPVSYEAFVEAVHRLGLFLQVVTIPTQLEARGA